MLPKRTTNNVIFASGSDLCKNKIKQKKTPWGPLP